MKIEFPAVQKVQYINLKPNGFMIEDKVHSKLECFMMEITQARKLFKGKKLLCYSNDGDSGSEGQKCAACRKQYRCQPRMRLTLSVENIRENPVTAILEINKTSFKNLENLLSGMEEKEISETLVTLTVNSKSRYLKVQFTPVF